VKRFAALYGELDSTTRTTVKTAALVDYFRDAPASDAAWAVFFLIGNRPRQTVRTANLQQWAAQTAALPMWLFAECYDAVGDLAETISLVLPAPRAKSALALTCWIEERILPLRDHAETLQRSLLQQYWNELEGYERFVFNKLITGAFRVGVSRLLVLRALSQVCGVDAKVIAHRLAGDWSPTPETYQRLMSRDGETFDVSKPYPFFLAQPLSTPASALGVIDAWQIEWKWDGIRGQLVKRNGQIFLWSRGEELITHQFPEIAQAASALPDCVLDGEIVVHKDDRVQPFAMLQRRLGRKAPTRKDLQDSPAAYLAYDVLEADLQDWRTRPLRERREKLERFLQSPASEKEMQTSDSILHLSEIVHAPSWEALAAIREQSRARGAEGLMLKRRDSPYRVGRVAGDFGGDWWKWKIAPLTLDCVLMYAQRGQGKRASLYTDYTFGVWRDIADRPGERELVPVAKAYSGLSDSEIAEVDAFVRRNTLEKFGPVRTVTPKLVFELAFEGIQRSSRHKSGVAVRFPRIARPRYDKTIDEADTTATIDRLLESPRAEDGIRRE
jgi:DNA ligase 1